MIPPILRHVSVHGKIEALSMRVGILTLHDAINHGSFSQAYCLQETIKALGHDPVFINYRSSKVEKLEKHTLLRKPRRLSRRACLAYYHNWKKFRIFKRFHRLFNLTERMQNLEKLDARPLDLVLYGSDEIWNLENPYAENGCLAYFGAEIAETTKIAYATSFGSLDESFVLDDQRRNLLKSFKAISVRDANSRRILDNNGIESQVVLDPTFLLPLDRYAKPLTTSCQDFIMLYLNQLSANNARKIREFAQARGLKIVSLAYKYKWVDANWVSIDPFSWAGCFASARFVVTNTYHGTIYSLLNKKRFLCLEVGNKVQKVGDVLSQFGLTSRLSEAFDPERLEEELDYDKVQSEMERARRHSKEFLRKWLPA